MNGSAPGALASRVGRRFAALFAGCALVPLIIFATLSVRFVTQQAEADLEAKLHDSAKTAGMGLAARLSQVAGDLALLTDFVRGHGDRPPALGHALRRQIDGHGRSMELWTANARRVLCGEDRRPNLLLSVDDLEHLATGKPLAVFVEEPPELVMVAATEPGTASTLVVARVRSSWFWDPEELRGVNCQFAAFDVRGRLLYHTFDTRPPTGDFAGTPRARSSSGTFHWQIAGKPHIARYWRAFLLPQYRLDLLVVQSQLRQDATAVGDAFVLTFWLTAAGTLLLVVLASLVQIRRTIGPIVRLRDAAIRLGRGELDIRARIIRRDEFGDLGHAFDEMAERLQSNIEKRERTERELVASRDAALAAVRAKATFVTNVSHELRTPMTEILSAAEILTMLDEGETEAREEFSGIALKGARRLSQLLDDVLALGDDAPASFEPTDVAAAVREAAAAMAEDARARIAIDVPEELPPTLGDARRLRETFSRLLDNAVKFSAADTPIEVRATVEGERIAVAVVDHGAGIDPADHARIFEPFCQVGRDQLIDKANGTGLGLTLARSIVEAFGGAITVESELGRGSTFRVVLPVHTEAAIA